MAPEFGTVVPPITVLGTRTRSQTSALLRVCSHTTSIRRAPACRLTRPTSTIPSVLKLKRDFLFLLRPREMKVVQTVSRYHAIPPLALLFYDVAAAVPPFKPDIAADVGICWCTVDPISTQHARTDNELVPSLPLVASCLGPCCCVSQDTTSTSITGTHHSTAEPS